MGRSQYRQTGDHPHARADLHMEALLKKVNGYVLLHGIIGTNGEMSDVRILQQLEASLDDAARRTLSQWRFRPATLNGEAVRVAITVKMAFTTR